MILFFHFLCLLARYIVINISKSIRERKKIPDVSKEEEALKNLSQSYLQNVKDVRPPVYKNESLRFFPPIYIQRYETVALILENFAEEGIIRKVVDFGCSELGLFPYLKNIESITEVLEVDVNEQLLKRSAHKAAPLTTDYLMGKRKTPLNVYLLAGSVAEYDDHLAGCDAVICVELIEHLLEDDFSKFPYVIFHQIKPKVAIFTTPNADFNALFPNFEGMRHEDHKFEWTRKEFYIWTQQIIFHYPEYSVRFYGVGTGPEGTENLGCCSQVAVFSKSYNVEPFSPTRECLEGFHTYKLIKHFNYPVYVDKRTPEEKVTQEIQHHLSYLSTLPDYFNYEKNETKIPLSLLKPYVKEFCWDDEEFLNILINSDMNVIKENDTWYLIVSETELNANSSDSSFEEEEDEWTNDSYGADAEDVENLEENWDLGEKPHVENNFELNVFHTARSFQDRKTEFDAQDGRKGEHAFKVQSKTQSLPANSNKLNKLMVGISEENYFKRRRRSRIPRKTSLREARCSVSNSFEENTHVGVAFTTISKSYSLDSCLENISSQTEFCLISDEQSHLLNVRSFSSGRRKKTVHESGSSLFTDSIGRAGDSGCPFSYLSPDDSTQELSSENDASRSSSDDEADVVLPRLEPFPERAVVENGLLANNVEGLTGQRSTSGRDANDVFFPELDDFPAWLLNLGVVAQEPHFNIVDTGLSDDDEGIEDENRICNESPNPNEFNLYFYG